MPRLVCNCCWLLCQKCGCNLRQHELNMSCCSCSAGLQHSLPENPIAQEVAQQLEPHIRGLVPVSLEGRTLAGAHRELGNCATVHHVADTIMRLPNLHRWVWGNTERCIEPATRVCTYIGYAMIVPVAPEMACISCVMPCPSCMQGNVSREHNSSAANKGGIWPQCSRA